MVTNQKFKARLESVRRSRGKRCALCGTYQAYGEFAHKEHYALKSVQGLKGMSRGRNSRVQDIIKHPDKYYLLCHDCHRDYDHQNGYDLL